MLIKVKVMFYFLDFLEIIYYVIFLVCVLNILLNNFVFIYFLDFDWKGGKF